MTESTRRLLAIRVERVRVETELRRWRARAASYELATAIEGDSPELHARHAYAFGQATGLMSWLAQVQRAEQRLARQISESVTEEQVA